MSSTAGKILVTGGAGFIGSHTVVDLIAHGHEPLIVDDFSNSDPRVLDGLRAICGRDIECRRMDCGDREAMRRVFETAGPIRGVVHFAASKAVGESQAQPLRYHRNNVVSLITLLELMDEFGVRDLVFSSSCVVYGEPDRLPVTESTPMGRAASVYGSTKQICESVIRDVVASGSSLRAVSLRYFNPIGAHPSAEIGELPIGVPENLIPVLMQSAAGLRGPIRVFGTDWGTPDGSCIRDYIHVLDLANAHVRSLDWMAGQGPEGMQAVFNLGTGRGTSVLEAIESFQQATGQSLRVEHAPRRPGDIEQIYANADRAHEILGWKAERTLEDAMRDAWRWQRRLGERA